MSTCDVHTNARLLFLKAIILNGIIRIQYSEGLLFIKASNRRKLKNKFNLISETDNDISIWTDILFSSI